METICEYGKPHCNGISIIHAFQKHFFSFTSFMLFFFSLTGVAGQPLGPLGGRATPMA
jgi:hypothetical protein